MNFNILCWSLTFVYKVKGTPEFNVLTLIFCNSIPSCLHYLFIISRFYLVRRPFKVRYATKI